MLGLTKEERKELKSEVEKTALQAHDFGCFIPESMDTKATAGGIHVELRHSQVLCSNKTTLIGK